MAVPGGNAPPPLVRQTSVVASRPWDQFVLPLHQRGIWWQGEKLRQFLIFPFISIGTFPFIVYTFVNVLIILSVS